MKIGDMVKNIPTVNSDKSRVGIIIGAIVSNPETIPPVVKVLWSSGEIDKEWTDELWVVK